ncbi:protein-(glutamine-N5) methyltransferase, release factor-specific [Bifidobacterium aemilianum]|uniref:Protein-(Glutamine-N5) methyltransferase, release factor-specific n=2 Tax=Bifidobacterium aemilianum TaxID=2493120 RepID=A0A366K6F9_9BIFI|nr:protein-(glutamine-N5) methyltransferase, release factor-specific [Bifidobacterium aemilianum]
MAHAYGVDLSDIRKFMVMGESLSTSPEPESPAAVSTEISGAPRQTEPPYPGFDSHLVFQSFRESLKRRANREPLQYILGQAPFRFLDLQVGPGVFIPRPETEAVVQAAIDWLDEHGLSSHRIVDLCAGSGAIGLSLVTEVRGAEVWAVEQSDEAYSWAAKNRESVLKEDIAAGYNYHLVKGDATSTTFLNELDGTIDLVVSNPPYVPENQIPEQAEVRDYDPDLSLYGGSVDGLRIPQKLVVRAASLLRAGGALVMEHDISQGKALVDFALNHGFASASTGMDLTGRPRYLLAELG